MKKYIFGALFLAFTVLLPAGSAHAQFNSGEAIEIVLDRNCVSYSLLRGDNKVAGDNCAEETWAGKQGIIFGAPRIGSSGIEYQVDLGFKESYVYSPNYGKPIYSWMPASMLRSINAPKQIVGSVTLTSSANLVRYEGTLPMFTARILDTSGQPVRGYTAKWTISTSGNTACGLGGTGLNGGSVLGQSTLSFYCRDGSVTIASPSSPVTVTVTSGGKSASVTVYYSYSGTKGPEALPPISSSTDSTIFRVGDVIKTICAANPLQGSAISNFVPSSILQPAGASGSVIGGPLNITILGSSLTSYNINFTNDPDGWIASRCLVQNPSGSSATPPPTSEADLVAQLRAQIAQLTAQIQALVNAQLGGASLRQQDSTSFAIGDKVQATTRVSVRTVPSRTIITTVEAGTQGTIIGGPVQAVFLDGVTYTWWNVQFGTVSGWSVGNYLERSN